MFACLFKKMLSAAASCLFFYLMFYRALLKSRQEVRKIEVNSVHFTYMVKYMRLQARKHTDFESQKKKSK